MRPCSESCHQPGEEDENAAAASHTQCDKPGWIDCCRSSCERALACFKIVRAVEQRMPFAGLIVAYEAASRRTGKSAHTQMASDCVAPSLSTGESHDRWQCMRCPLSAKHIFPKRRPRPWAPKPHPDIKRCRG